MYISMQNLWFSLQYVIQLFSADATMFKKRPSRYHISAWFGPVSNQAKYQILFHKNVLPRDLCIMTLNVLVYIVNVVKVSTNV
jgi:hypothetical protein